MSSLLRRKLDTNLYKNVTSVIRCCQTNSDTIGDFRYFGYKWNIFLGTSGTLGTRGTSAGRRCDIFSGNHMYYQPTLYTCQRTFHNPSGKNLVSSLYMSYVCITKLPENIPARLPHQLNLHKTKNPLHFCKGFLNLTTKNKQLHFYCLWNNPHSVHNFILLLGA